MKMLGENVQYNPNDVYQTAGVPSRKVMKVSKDYDKI